MSATVPRTAPTWPRAPSESHQIEKPSSRPASDGLPGPARNRPMPDAVATPSHSSDDRRDAAVATSVATRSRRCAAASGSSCTTPAGAARSRRWPPSGRGRARCPRAVATTGRWPRGPARSTRPRRRSPRTPRVPGRSRAGGGRDPSGSSGPAPRAAGPRVGRQPGSARRRRAASAIRHPRKATSRSGPTNRPRSVTFHTRNSGRGHLAVARLEQDPVGHGRGEAHVDGHRDERREDRQRPERHAGAGSSRGHCTATPMASAISPVSTWWPGKTACPSMSALPLSSDQR